MSEFLLITGSHILTPNTPSSHHPGDESRRNLMDFYKQVYVPKLEPFVKQFRPLAGVSRCAQNCTLWLWWIFWRVCVAVRWKLLLCLHTWNSQGQLFSNKGYPTVYTFPHVTETPHPRGLPWSPTHSTQAPGRSVNTPLRLCFRSMFSLFFPLQILLLFSNSVWRTWIKCSNTICRQKRRARMSPWWRVLAWETSPFTSSDWEISWMTAWQQWLRTEPCL